MKRKEIKMNAHYAIYELMKVIINEVESNEFEGKELLLADLYQIQNKYYDKLIEKITEEHEAFLDMLHRYAQELKEEYDDDE